MILFISRYPDGDREKDGMMQRVLAVDSHFAGCERVYLGIEFFGNARRTERVSDGLRVLRVNFFIHFLLILRLGFSADGIFVHSVHNGFRAIFLYLFRKVVTDLHGVFPEELRYCGKKAASVLYGLVERVALRRSRAVIAVTETMADHLRVKYAHLRTRIYTMPIFDDLPIGREGDAEPGSLVAIYSGGSQQWQKIDPMMEAMSRVRYPCSFVILTQDVPFFMHKVEDYGLSDRVLILSVPKSEVRGHYLRADLGFVLRDDSIVNRAACPTKLVEYLASGVIPIVLNPDIGDFARLGYSRIGLEQFEHGDLPSREEMEDMRVNNYRILRGMRVKAEETMRLVAAELIPSGAGHGA